MVPIFTSTIDNKMLNSNALRRKNGSSFGSSGSFGSFGSMGVDEALIIMNPCDYTI